MSLLANHGLIGKTTPVVVQAIGRSATSTSLVYTFASTPTDGNRLLLFYRSTQGAPTADPTAAGFTLKFSLDNNALGIYVYEKIASSETNSYTFTDAVSEFKGCSGVEIRGSSYSNVELTGDSLASTTTTNHLPPFVTHQYAANSMTLGFVVLLLNRAITRTPLTAIASPPTDGSAGTFKAMLANRLNEAFSDFRIEFSWASGVRNKAISMVII